MRSLRKLPAFVAVLAAAGCLLTACPQPNGYTIAPRVPAAAIQQHGRAAARPGRRRPRAAADAGRRHPPRRPRRRRRAADRLPRHPRPHHPRIRARSRACSAWRSRRTTPRAADSTSTTPSAVRCGTASRASSPTAIPPTPAPSSVLLEINQPFQNHNGGALAFGPDGMFYVGVGDGGSAGDPAGYAQRFDSLHGKILRLDVSGAGYAIPPDNPFVGQDARGEIYALGTAQSVAHQLRPGDGTALGGRCRPGRVGRSGPHRRRRQLRLEPSPRASHCYEPAEGCNAPDWSLPRIEYSHEFGCAITGGFVYRGAAMPELFGWYVYGDYCTRPRLGASTPPARCAPAIPLADTGTHRSRHSRRTARRRTLHRHVQQRDRPDSSGSNHARLAGEPRHPAQFAARLLIAVTRRPIVIASTKPFVA